MRKPRALRPGDRIAIVAPASPFAREEFDAGVAELSRLGFEPVYEETVFARHGYVAGAAASRARARSSRLAGSGHRRADRRPRRLRQRPAAAAARSRRRSAATPKAFIGYSDNTVAADLAHARTCGLVAFHGPMLEGRLAKGQAGYDRDTFRRCLCRPNRRRAIAHPHVEVAQPRRGAGRAARRHADAAHGVARDAVRVRSRRRARPVPRRSGRAAVPHRSHADAAPAQRAAVARVGHRLRRAARCDEPGGSPIVREVVADLLRDFPGPVLFGLPSGHTTGPTMTLPFGVRARVVATPSPALVIEEAAVAETFVSE